MQCMLKLPFKETDTTQWDVTSLLNLPIPTHALIRRHQVWNTTIYVHWRWRVYAAGNRTPVAQGVLYNYPIKYLRGNILPYIQKREKINYISRLSASFASSTGYTQTSDACLPASSSPSSNPILHQASPSPISRFLLSCAYSHRRDIA